MNAQRGAATVFAAILLGGCAACGSGAHTGPLHQDPVSVDLDQSEMVRAQLKIGAGKLSIHGGASKLLEGTFTYNIDGWAPRVSYNPSSFRGVLTIEQPKRTSVIGDVRNDWDLAFNNAKPIDLSIECGAGEADLSLGSLNLRGLGIEIGAGKVDLDLRGMPKSSYNVSIEGGVGEAIVHVPDTVGVSAEAHGGIGQIEVEGLKQDEDHYVNNLWSTSDVRVRLSVEGGIGHIRIISG